MKTHDSLTRIEELTLLPGISGREDAVADYVQEALKGIGTLSRDRIGNIICTIEGSDPSAPALLFAAHMDEIGFLVSDITPDGFLRVQPVGGWNPATLSSAEVDIINREEKPVRGVFGLISPHFLPKGKEREIPSIDELFIDVGAVDSLQVSEHLGIGIGSPVIPAGRFSYREESGTMVSKAFDDRIGVAALVEFALHLREKPPVNTVKLAFTVQEEVGVRGASVLSNTVEADFALIVEGAPADDIPGGAQRPQTAVGKGAHVRIFDPTHIGSPRLLSHIDRLSREKSFVIQKSVRKGGGTDASKIALAGRGIEAIVVGVPVRYAHSHSGVCSLHDYRQLLELLYALSEYKGF